MQSARGDFSKNFRSLDEGANCPAVTRICASPDCQSLSASCTAAVMPSPPPSTQTARGPGKKPMDFISSIKIAGDLRRSAAETVIRRISSAAFEPSHASNTSLRRRATRIASMPYKRTAGCLLCGLAKNAVASRALAFMGSRGAAEDPAQSCHTSGRPKWRCSARCHRFPRPIPSVYRPHRGTRRAPAPCLRIA